LRKRGKNRLKTQWYVFVSVLNLFKSNPASVSDFLSLDIHCGAMYRVHMFDLDKAVLEWRRRMVGAGIKRLVVLAELESQGGGTADAFGFNGAGGF
jgi:hypothetical protein